MFKGNKIYKIENGKRTRIFFIPGMRVSFKGKNSTVEIHYPLPEILRGCRIKLGNNCKFVMESSDKWITKLEVFALGNNNECYIGKNLSVTNGCEIHLSPEDNLKVEIGDNCMFGKNIVLRATDGHTIYNETTQEIINKGKNIKIGNHVWIAENTRILKGVSIADNCVVGMNSIVTKSVDETGSVAAGSPARVVKTGINWRREAPSYIVNN